MTPLASQTLTLEQQSVDTKSLLSIIANSATVEVWIIDQDVLSLLPQDVQTKIISRLRAEQKEKINGIDLSKRPKEEEMKRIREG